MESPSSIPKALTDQSRIQNSMTEETFSISMHISQEASPGRSSPISEPSESSVPETHAVIRQIDIPINMINEKDSKLGTGTPSLSISSDCDADLAYNNAASGYQTFHYNKPYSLKYNGCVLPEFTIAYETWGELNKDENNVVLVYTGVSSSSYTRSHKDNQSKGWWEKFIGPDCAIDTNKFFVICCNHIGGCSGSTGPSSINPMTDQPYGATFPLVSVEDMVKVHAVVGASMGGMCSLMSAALYPKRTGRELAMMTYRSGIEWEERFGRKLIDPASSPSLCPSFQVESYIRHQGETFCNKHDPNSLLYMNKALVMFDMGDGFSSLQDGMARVRCPVMVLGVKTDILFPIWQQRELVNLLKDSGNTAVTFYELDSLCGHDTFLLDLTNFGCAIKGYLETDLNETGYGQKSHTK